jgi:acetyl esterase/lipase
MQYDRPKEESMSDRSAQPTGMPPRFDVPNTITDVTTLDGVVTYPDIEFAQVDGFRPLRLDLRVPVAPGPVPVVVYIHGGAFRFGSRRRGPVMEPIRFGLLQRGMAVAAIEYRLSGEALFPACLHDVKAAVRWLRTFGADLGLLPEAIGAWGESAGAHLAAFLGLNSRDAELNGAVGVTEASADVQAVVAWYPPTTFLAMDDDARSEGRPSGQPHDAPDSPESRLIGGALQDHPEAARFASPSTHVRSGAAPVLLIHGLDDTSVPHGQSIHLQQALRSVDADVTLDLIPDAGHVFAGIDPTAITSRSAGYLAYRLGRIAAGTIQDDELA